MKITLVEYTHFLLLEILARGTAPHKRKHTDMAIKGGGANHGRVPRAPGNVKTPLSCGWQLINNLKEKIIDKI